MMVLGVASLLTLGCTKEKMVQKELKNSDHQSSTSSRGYIASRNAALGCITLAADKNTPALGVAVGNGGEDNLWFDIGVDGRINAIGDKYSYSAPGSKDIGLITSRATLRLVSKDGKWKIYFHRGKLSVNTKIVLFKLSVSNQDFLSYLHEKMEAKMNYTRYLQLSEELKRRIAENPYANIEQREIDEHNQLADEIAEISAYRNLQSDKINGKPIIVGRIEIDYNQLINSTLYEPVAVAW